VGGEGSGKGGTKRGDQAGEELVEDGVEVGLSMFQVSARDRALFGLEDAGGEGGRRLKRRCGVRLKVAEEEGRHGPGGSQ
jgi:hypothetical protein